MPGELGWVANDQAKGFPLPSKRFEGLEDVGDLEPGRGHPIQRGVLAGEIDRRPRPVDPQDRVRPALERRGEGKPAGVAKEIKHPPLTCVGRDGAAIGPLVEVETSLLTGGEVNGVANSTIDDLDQAGGRLAPDPTFLNLEPFLRGGFLFLLEESLQAPRCAPSAS